MLFEYTNKKPTLAGAWKELNKTDFESNTKVLIWLNIILVDDFKTFKTDTLAIITKETEEEYCNGFVQNIKDVFGLVLDTDLQTHTFQVHITFNTTFDKAILNLLEMMYHDNPKIVGLDFIYKLFTDTVLPNKIEHIYPNKYSKLENLTALEAKLLYNKDTLFIEPNFRDIFKNSNDNVVTLNSEYEIKFNLMILLLQYIENGKQTSYVEIPTFKLKT